MCPLLWCRERFDSLASTLQHVSECPWLSNTWYWCPYCCRPESFVGSKDPDADLPNPKLQRKDSKLRRAVTFFKHLGHKSCSRHKRSGSPSHDSWLANRKRSEMEDTSHDISSSVELGSQTVYEMGDTALYPSWNLEDPPQYSQEAGTAVEPFELDIDMAEQSNGAAGKIAGFLTGVGAQFEAAQDDTEPREEMLVSPVSNIQSPFVCQSTGVDMLRHAVSGSVSPTSGDFGTVPSPENFGHDWRQNKVTPALNGSVLSSNNNGSLCDGVTLSTRSQVEELREMVRLLNEEWMRRCQSIPDLVLPASVVSPRTLFETGAQTLQHLLRGVLPGTFDAVFALAHITCASAYIMRGDDGSHCWNEFFQDILRWHHLMPTKSDAGLFIRLVNLLWWPRGSSAKLSCGNYFLDETSGTLVPLRRPAAGFDASSSAEINEMQPPRWPTKSALVPILNSLKDGAALQECLRFLDGKPTYQCLLIMTWPDLSFQESNTPKSWKEAKNVPLICPGTLRIMSPASKR